MYDFVVINIACLPRKTNVHGQLENVCWCNLCGRMLSHTWSCLYYNL